MRTGDAARRLGGLLAIGLLAAPLSAQQALIFRSGVRLVEVNVLVHDRAGQPVADLQQSDFTVFEDGKEQPIAAFAVESNRQSASASVGASPAPNVFTNRLPHRVGGGVTVILFDRLNSNWEDQKYARDQILTVLAKAQPADHIALYVLDSDVVTVLHDFTSDASRLVRVLNQYLGKTSVELAGSTEAAPTFAPTGSASEDAATQAWLDRSMLAISEIFLRRRAELTTNALESIANHLASVPGRKNLVWVSGGFPVVIPGEHGPMIMDREINRASRAINDANIAIYPIDIRGLVGIFTNPNAATATTSAKGARPGPVFQNINTISPNQDVMRQVADATGGRAFMDNNAIGELVRRAMDDSRVSYVLGYYSTRAEPDGKFHAIDVKVKRGGVDVRHRKGYSALKPEPLKDSRTRLAALYRVMTSPLEVSQLEVAAELDRTSDREATLTIRLDPSAISWELKKDVREGAIDVVIAQSEPDGKYYKQMETTVNLAADADRYKQMVEDGFTLSKSVTLRPTAYRLHVIVSDVASQAVGSLIIPIKH